MSKLPNISPKVFTLSATAIGYLLLDELNQTEQNAIGNWLMLIGQILETNAAYQVHQTTNTNQSYDINSTINALKKTLNTIEKELQDIKKYNQ